MTIRSLSDDVHELGAILGDVLREQAGPAAFELVESLRQTLVERRRSGPVDDDGHDVKARLAALSSLELETVVRAFGLYFNLVNLAEEHERVRRRKKNPGGGKQSLDAALAALQAQGRSADDVDALIAATPLLLTFTAHPTEMRRRTVREHLATIASSLEELDQRALAGDDDGARSVRERIGARVEALFGTAELRDRAPTVQDEVKGGLAYVSVLAAAMVDVEQSLRRAFATHFGRPLRAPLPLGLHSWMGGDRDGNPNVTAEVTRDTLIAHQKEADRLLRDELVGLFAVVSQHALRLRAIAPADTTTQTKATTTAAAEPFRERIEAAVRALAEDPGFDPQPALEEVSALLLAAGQERTATTLLAPARCLARVLGRRLARLDVREHSLHIGRCVAELFQHGGVDDYAQRDEAGRRALLEAELLSQRPFLGVGAVGSAEVELVVGPLRVLRERGLHDTRFIVSMTDEVSDLLEVLVVAREAGVRVLPVPLFETLKDLQAGPAIMKALLHSPAYRKAMSAGPTGEVQEVMLGYSDSNKDAGPIAAVFGLYRAQQEIAAVCADAGVPWRFFHGRGTSLGRGGGPLARAILGQPPGTIGAGLRLTEQGEALADKYGDPALARRNLEQGLYGLLLAAGAPLPAAHDKDKELLEAMSAAAASSRVAYRALVTDADFMRFFTAVTPIEEIARLKVASRPVRRHGQAPTLENLRAIPWVMSWTQNRLNLPGWYGADVAFSTLGVAMCRRMLAGWPAFRSLLDNLQMGLAKSDAVIFRAYAALDDVGSPLAARLLEVRARTLQLVEEITEAPLLAHEPHLLRSIQLRNPYIEPIHRAQVELLHRSRAGQRTVVEDRALLSTILGIAAGVRNAG